MLAPEIVLSIIIIIWIFFYTASYGHWTWNTNNKLGAVMIYIVAVTQLLLALYGMFFKI